ncbi:hypothetical protein TWF694_009652 [Orbilia ellipsospora]|uniref:Uncharacterized protein n=1 Tax=Orbilia ellipsospora TaxID=2528407 RepID=A0AAV9XCN4_9PEZI
MPKIQSPTHQLLKFNRQPSLSKPNMTTNMCSLPIPTPEPRKRSIWEMSFDMDFTLYPDSPTLPHALDDVDLEDITIRGVTKASSFKHQEYAPSMLMYHPFDEKAYPEPAEWERMFDDLDSFPSRVRSPSVATVNTTAAAPPASRRGSVQFTPSTSSASVSRPNCACTETATRSSRRQDASAYPAHRRLSAMLANFSFCRSQESLSPRYQRSIYSQDISPSRRTSKTSLSMVPTTPSTAFSSRSRSVSSMHAHRQRHVSRRSNSQLLSHIGVGLMPCRMDNHSEDLQQVVAGIPVSAFIHPKMHIPGSAEYGPVQEDGGFDDAYPLRITRLWSFDEPKLPIELCNFDLYDLDSVIDACGKESTSQLGTGNRML